MNLSSSTSARLAGSLLALTISFTAAPSPAATRGPLRVGSTPTRFEDASGRTVWLTGMMICCQDAQANGWPWISRPMIDRLAAAGGNWANIRLGPFTRAGELPRFEPYRYLGGVSYDLDHWNDAFWTDFRNTVAYAQGKGVYVEVDLIDAWVLENPPDEDRSLFSPWKAGNNVNGVADDCSILHGPPAPHHVRWLEKVAETVGEFDNVVFQVGNETSDCQGGGTSVAWESGVIQTVRQALLASGHGDRLFSTNSHSAEVESLTDVDYVNLHTDEAVFIRAGKPTGVNEYPEEAFDANGYTRAMWAGFTNGTFFHYWRGDDDTPTFDTVLSRLAVFRDFLARTGLARYDAYPVGFRVVGSYGREYVGFLPYGGSREIDLGPAVREFKVDWLDPRTGLLTPGGTVTASGPHVFEAPAPTSVMRVAHVYATDGCPDCTPPSLAASAAGNVVSLRWDNDYVGVRRYRIERRLEPGGAWEEIALNIPAHTRTYQDPLPPPSPVATYSYRVRALYLYGGWGYSNEASVTLHDAPPSPPAALSPTGCADMPPRFRWTPSATADGYYLRARTAVGGVSLIDNSSIVAPSYVPSSSGELSRLAQHVGEGVVWSVKACNNMGCSGWSPDAGFTLRRAVRADFDGDCRSDLLLRHRTTGDLGAWLLDGNTRVGETALDPPRPLAGNWSLAGTHDFDDDGNADLLWWNADSGNLALWFLDGATRIGSAFVPGPGDLGWRVAATADVDGDRRGDILWRHRDTGELLAWLTRAGLPPVAADVTPSSMAPAWDVAAMGDLTGDGEPDILWRHQTTGELRYWAMDGLRRIGEGPVSTPQTPDTGWRVVGLWHVDQDAGLDIVWQNRTSGALVVWYMDGTHHGSGAYFVPDRPEADREAVGPR